MLLSPTNMNTDLILGADASVWAVCDRGQASDQKQLYFRWHKMTQMHFWITSLMLSRSCRTNIFMMKRRTIGWISNIFLSRTMTNITLKPLIKNELTMLVWNMTSTDFYFPQTDVGWFLSFQSHACCFQHDLSACPAHQCGSLGEIFGVLFAGFTILMEL